MAAKGQFLQRLGNRADGRRRGRLRARADVGSGARAVRRVRRLGGGRRLVRLVFQPVLGAASRSERPVDSSRAPSPQKLDVQPTGGSVLVLGDSMADWLAYGLEDALGDPPDLAVVRKNRATSGLIRYDSRNETQDWAQVIREAIAADQAEVHRDDGRLERSRVDPRSRADAGVAGAPGRRPRRRQLRRRPHRSSQRRRPRPSPTMRMPSRRRPNSR